MSTASMLPSQVLSKSTYVVAMCTAFISPIVAEVFLIAAAGLLLLFPFRPSSH